MARHWAWGGLMIGGACVAGCHVISPEHLKGDRPETPATTVSRVAKEPETVSKPTPAAPMAAATSEATEVVTDDPLGLAVDAMVAGKDAEAATQLAKHLKAHPEQLVFRNQLAELLFKLERHAEAQYHFEKFDELASGSSKSLLGQRIHCHTRLMEIAQARENPFREKLHRGIGLYLIACEVQSKADDPSELSPDAEKLWCRAANELNEARRFRESDTRTAWYLYLVWTRLDQPRPAEKALHHAAANLVFSPLPTGEDRELRGVLESVSNRPATQRVSR